MARFIPEADRMMGSFRSGGIVLFSAAAFSTIQIHYYGSEIGPTKQKLSLARFQFRQASKGLEIIWTRFTLAPKLHPTTETRITVLRMG
jgi:hypothetical protein